MDTLVLIVVMCAKDHPRGGGWGVDLQPDLEALLM